VPRARPPASEERPAGRPGVCRAECVRRGLGLRRSTLLAVVARRDAAPMKRLGMGSGSRISMEWAAPRRTVHRRRAQWRAYTCSASAPRWVRAPLWSREFRRSERGVVNHREGEGTAPGRIGSSLLGQTGGNTPSRHRKGHVAPSNSGHKLRGRTCVINVAHRGNLSYLV
jgi:hypothetical protein